VRYFLSELIKGSPIYTVERDGDGFVFQAAENQLQEFSDLVRLASEKAGTEYMVFPTPAGPGLYKGMYVVPLPPDISSIPRPK